MVGETLNDRYRIERRLGGGSQAEVFLATDVHMERLVAIKIWKPEGGFTVDEFLREAKLLARFGAPHFVTIHEHAATLDQRPFFVLEYLQGETLQDLSTPLTAEEVCRCVRDVCVGLQKAHDEGVVHRDLKPSNLMVVDRGLRTERYVILDLGIAKITDTSNWRQTLADATMAGAGTLLYMSPEQCNGNPIDQRTDVYAFGCLLFMLLVQEEPFANKASSHLSVLNAILSDPPRRLAEVRPDGVFSEALEQLVQDCLAKKPEERPASMSEVEARFEACAPENGLLLSTSTPGGRSGPGSSGIRTRRPIGSSTHPNRRPKRRLLTMGLFALLATAASGLAFFLTRPSSEATSSRKTPAETPLTQTPLTKTSQTQAVESPKVDGTHASPEKTKDPLPNLPVKQVSTRTTAPSTSHPTEPVATRTEPHTPITPPVVQKPVIRPPTPPSTKDDRYFVVRNRTLSADDAFGKNKEQNRYGVLVNDGLPSGKSPEAECVEQPRFGPLQFHKDGTFTYACTPQPGGELVHGDTFKYRVRASDKEPWSEPESVDIVIRPFSDEEDTVVKRIEAAYGAASIRKGENPPAVIVDFAEQRVKKPILDVSLSVLDGLGEVLRELQLDSQPITDSALEHLRRFPELQILSLAGTDVSSAGLPKLASLKNLTDVDLSDTLLAEADVVAFGSGAGRPRVRRDGKIDRLRNLGVAITGKNDLALGRNAFVGTIPAVSLADFQKISLALKDAPRLVGLVVSNPEIGDESLTDSWVRELKFLKSLDLRGTLVSPPQIALFKKEFPSLKVEWDRPLEQLRSVGTVTESADGPVAIDLSGKKVDSRTWTLLSQVDKLATLNLSRVKIDGVGFQRLLQLAGLRALTLQGTPLPGKQVLEVCHAIPSLVELDVQKSPIAQENNWLRAIQAELRSHDAKGKVHPEPVDLGPGLLVAPFDAKDASLARAAWAGYLNSPEQRVNSIGMKLQLIPPGEFRMGSEDTYLELLDRYPTVRETEEDNPVSRLVLESARPQHMVRITKPYYLGAYEVTNAQFNKFLDATGRKPVVPKNGRPAWGFPPKKKTEAPEKPNKLSKRYWGNDPKGPGVKPNAPPANPVPVQPANAPPSEQAPVVNVTWEDAVAFCEWLSAQKEEIKEKRVYRLPTEAEWEYACRAGSTTRFWKDDDPEHLTLIGNVRDLAYKEKYGKENTLNSSDGAADPCDVGQYLPNQFDLYDVHGNVAEWCSDWFSKSYYRQAQHENPTGPSTGALRVVRGGSWHSSGIFSRSANRAAEPPTHRFDRIGFRVVCVERRTPWPPVVSAPVVPAAGPAPQLLVAPFDAKQAVDARKAWAQYAQIDEVDPKNLAGLSMTLIPPGEFMMGSTPEQIEQVAQTDPTFKKDGGNHEQPQHRVRITRPFYLSAHEVTREQFTRFIKATGYKTVGERPGAKPAQGFDAATGKFKPDKKINWHNTGFAQEDNHPVVYVSWKDALAFCNWLTWQEGRIYRLPTEAEWEYACRAGTTTLYYNGDDAESLVTVANVMDETAKGTFSSASLHALKARDGFVFTAPVGSFKANAFGLFDMHGNVREWCADWSADDYYARSPENDPPGASSGNTRVLRGGAWTSQAAACRSASRGGLGPLHVAHNVGFRVAADPPAK